MPVSANTPNDAAQKLPNPQDLEILQKRFALVDLNDPVYQALFNFVAERLPREGSSNLYHRKSSPWNNQETLKPFDPINIVQMDIKLPTMPTVLGELQEVTSKEYASASTVGDVIAKDPSLTAWVLKLVNSPFFGFSVKVDTVTRAVALLGVEQIKTLAIGGMLQNLVVRMPKGILNLEDFWRHSIATSIAAQTIWKALGKKDSERLFVAGLLHDCGILALAYASPDIAKALNASCHLSGKQRHLIEQELVSFDHARLGGMLLHRWNMPLPLVMAVLRHHEVEAPERYTEAAVVHLADVIAFAVAGISVDDLVPPIDPAVWKVLRLDQSKINFTADSIVEKLNDLCTVLRV
jgi:HD-like signal output (HDOD) protein